MGPQARLGQTLAQSKASFASSPIAFQDDLFCGRPRGGRARRGRGGVNGGGAGEPFRYIANPCRQHVLRQKAVVGGDDLSWQGARGAGSYQVGQQPRRCAHETNRQVHFLAILPPDYAATASQRHPTREHNPGKAARRKQNSVGNQLRCAENFRPPGGPRPTGTKTLQ